MSGAKSATDAPGDEDLAGWNLDADAGPNAAPDADAARTEAGVRPAAAVEPGMEVVRRVSADGDRSYLFCLDHTGAEQRVPARGVDLITGAWVEGEVRVPPRGVAVVRETQG